MKRLALIALAALPLAACDTTKVTQQFGQVVFHAEPAPQIATAVTVVNGERSPQLHADYEPCAELMIDNPACPQAPTHFDAAPEIGDAVTVERFPRTVEALPDSCQLVVRQDGDYLRARWENGQQAPCTPCVEHDIETPETTCGKVVVP